MKNENNLFIDCTSRSAYGLARPKSKLKFARLRQIPRASRTGKLFHFRHYAIKLVYEVTMIMELSKSSN